MPKLDFEFTAGIIQQMALEIRENRTIAAKIHTLMAYFQSVVTLARVLNITEQQVIDKVHAIYADDVDDEALDGVKEILLKYVGGRR